ncbi:MAG: heavy metal-binding domain-containing protein [Acidimicrobiia bacterium]|nr:heavy metal-binding domain-containing protein [Acidimicrobiia bacterium]
MLLTTSAILQDVTITHYLGLVTGEAILGTETFRNAFDNIRELVGGRAALYQQELARARNLAFEELTDQAQGLGANAVIAVDIDYETIGTSMLLVSATGTAVFATAERQ